MRAAQGLLGLGGTGKKAAQLWQVYCKRHYEADGLRAEAEEVLKKRRSNMHWEGGKLSFLSCVKEVCEAKLANMSETERETFKRSITTKEKALPMPREVNELDVSVDGNVVGGSSIMQERRQM